jgi:protein-S-isoprenylcysteine O-methyltransferase Ste14
MSGIGNSGAGELRYERGTLFLHGFRVRQMFLLARTVTYAALFIGFVLIFFPTRILSATGVVRPSVLGLWQVGGMLLATSGAVLALMCIFAFTLIGIGTPAPFDPPRRLVTRGPYRLVRNPMYAGAGLTLVGAALFYHSAPLAGYAGLFLIVTHLFVVFYEEPTLRQTFGTDYEVYCRQVGRWWPKRRGVRLFARSYRRSAPSSR